MGMTNGSFPLGSLFGIPIRLHVTFPLVFAAALLAQSSFSWAGLAWAALVYGPLLLLTVLVHEMGHSLAARRLGSEAHGILLWPLGGLAFVGHSVGPKEDLLVALAGPLTHIPQFLIWFAIFLPLHHAATGSWGHISTSIPSPQHHFGLAVVAGACWLNVMLSLFNLLLPAYPLDGGRILADTLLLLGVGEVTAAKITAVLAVVLGLGVVAWGVWAISVLTIAVGAWMLYATWGLVAAIREGTVHQHPMFCYEEQAGGEVPQVAVGKDGYAPYSGQGTV